ncbi:MAG: glycosyltransferase [Arenimonas sp.]
MRRLTVVQLLPALGSGGVERATLEIAAALVKAGHRSIVISAGGRLAPALQSTGSEHIALDIGAKSLATLRHVFSLRRIFARLRPDIVHARSRLPAWIARLALIGLRGPRFITSVHGLNSPGFYSSILTRGERVLCVSPTVRAHVQRQWPDTDPEKLLVIEPGIDAAVFCAGMGTDARIDADAEAEGDANVNADATRAAGEKILLMPGRGTRLKGHTAALTLLSGIRAAGVDARLQLLGAHEPGREAYMRELDSVARGLGVAAFFQAMPPSNDIVSAYRQCDLVLQLSSRPEAFGRTVIEALAVGKPVVGWAHGGVGDSLARYFPEGLVPLGDQQALLATTLYLLARGVTPARIYPQTLHDMQANTLKVYESIAG